MTGVYFKKYNGISNLWQVVYLCGLFANGLWLIYVVVYKRYLID